MKTFRNIFFANCMYACMISGTDLKRYLSQGARNSKGC